VWVQGELVCSLVELVETNEHTNSLLPSIPNRILIASTRPQIRSYLNPLF